MFHLCRWLGKWSDLGRESRLSGSFTGSPSYKKHFTYTIYKAIKYFNKLIVNQDYFVTKTTWTNKPFRRGILSCFPSYTAKTQYRKFETNIPRMKLRGLVPNSYIYVSVSDLYIPMISLPILLQENRWTYLGNRYRSHIHECRN